MDEQEDIGQLVVGITGAAFFEKLFAEGQTRSGESLRGWFDQESATIDGQDVVDRVKAMLGNVARFDFAQVGKNLPRVDLPDLERFFSMMLETVGRRVMRRENGLEVKTPEAWAEADYALADRYSDLVFERDAAGGRTGAVRIVGVGHRLFDQALQRAGQLSGVLAHCARLQSPLLVASVEDEVTGQGSSVTRICLGVTLDTAGLPILLRDWELLQLLNTTGRSDRVDNSADPDVLTSVAGKLLAHAEVEIGGLVDMMVRPKLRMEILLVPETGSAS
jgi:hypothetical protein